VIVTLNLYGDIISDIAAEVAGSVGMGGSANVGSDYAMFEAIHGSAPDIAGQGIANPSGLLGGAVMMLVHLGKPDVAAKVRNGWLRTIEDGIHTGDIFRPQVSTQKVGTQEFADAVIERLGQEPAKHLSPESFGEPKTFDLSVRPRERKTKQLVGVDVFCDWHDGDRNDANVIGRRLDEASTDTLRLKLITNRGVLVYPEGNDATWRTDHWRCRFTSPNGAAIAFDDVLELLRSLDSAGLDVIKTEHLYTFDGQRGYSLAQGE
jgi:isocitrate dehydrogenase